MATPPLQPNPNRAPQEMSKRDKSHDQDKNQEENSINKEKVVTHNTKIQTERPFDLEAEIGKLKIAIPLSELAKHDIYKQQIKKSLQLTRNKDNVNVLDDTPELLFGPEVDGKTAVTGILPFYVSLHVHDKILHNAMFDSGASHNLMPKSVMERLNLDITRPYKDLFSFDSIQVKFLGLIKYLCVSLVQYPNKTILMDVVVADIPPKYGMLLSRSWGAKLQGSLQLDMSHATISVFGQPKRLYRESLMKYMVSSEDKPQNFPIYAVHSNIDSYILFNDNTGPTNDEEIQSIKQDQHINEETPNLETFVDDSKDKNVQKDKPNASQDLKLLMPSTTIIDNASFSQEILWFLEFDGSVNKFGVGAGVWIHNKQNNHAEGRAYRLNLGSAAAEILNSFTEFQITKIPRTHNLHAHSLATFASTCKLPFETQHCFAAEVKHRPSVPNNVKYWQVFEDDKQTNNFLTLQQEFAGLNIDTETASDSQKPGEQNHTNISLKTANQMLCPTNFDQENIQELEQVHSKELAHTEAEVIQWKDNFLPTGLDLLEDILDSNDVPRKPKLQPLNAVIEECNIGTVEKPKIIKLSASLPPDQNPKYIDLFKEFQDVFAWSYEDLKSYDTSIIQHTIPLKPNQKPFKQKLRRIIPTLLPSIEKEVQKMFKAGIIAPIRFSEWISNLVPTRKKIGEIKLCVDLRNLNQVSLKDNYPLPKMDHILQRVVGTSRISLLDGFSGYNQILVHPDDQGKTTFTTPWGTFKYVKMPFGLKNARATFQRAMDIAFSKEICDFLVIYLDDLTPFSKSNQEHLKHLKQIFTTCRKYGISLNPKKSLFGLC
eukprot:PITA_28367